LEPFEGKPFTVRSATTKEPRYPDVGIGHRSTGGA
jgi:hypothetical protein